MLRAALIVPALAAVLAVGCSDDAEDDIEGYIERANAVQQQAAPELGRANDVYARFASGRLPAAEAAEELAGAERTLLGTRAELAELEPPADARGLHTELIRYLDLHTELAGETTALAEYLPAADAALEGLPTAGRRLNRRLEAADEPAGQARALALYRQALDRSIDRLERLEPPPVVAASHRERIRRLRSLRALSRGLERAIRGRDARRVARLLLRFRDERGDAGAVPVLDERSVRDYRRRYDRARRQAAEVKREEARLQRRLLADE